MKALELLLTRLREAAEHDIHDVTDAVSDWVAGEKTEGMIGWKRASLLYDALVLASDVVVKGPPNECNEENEV